MNQKVIKVEPSKEVSKQKDESTIKRLILHNDEVNTFDHVIQCLVSICYHDSHQAEQCAFITHYKGKCDIKTGPLNELRGMREALMSQGLRVTID